MLKMYSYYKHNTAEADPLGKTRTCLFCFDHCAIETSIPNDSQKLFEKCSKYVHSAIISDPSTYSPELNLLATKQIVPFCGKCLKSAVELSGFIEQLEFCQRKITELAFTFSLGILHRRRKSSAVANIGSKRRKIQEFDITTLPDFDNELEESESEQGTYSFLQSNYEKSISSSEVDEIDDRNLEIETPLPVQCELENSQLSYLSFGEIIVETGQVDIFREGAPTHAVEFKESNFIGVKTTKPSKTTVLSKTDIANSPFPIVKLDRLKLGEDGTVENLQQLLQAKNSKTISTNDIAVFNVHQPEASYHSHQARDSKISSFPGHSGIAVNMSTMGIKIEDVATFEDGRENVINETSKYATGQDELYDPLNYDGATNRFRCVQCKKGFSSKFMLLAHEKKHLNSYCSICNKNFATKNSLRNHQLLHTGEKPFTCSVCHKGFTVKQSLKIHERLHTGEKPFQCNICGKSFTFHSGLFTHKSVHSQERPFQCLVCRKRFPLKQTLVTHLKTHDKPNFISKPGRKSTCDPTFNVETAKMEYKCEICQKVLSCKQSLYIHMQVHKMSHKCPICDKRFALKLGLNNHIARHTGENHYKCQQCDYATSGPNKLRYHRITAHSKTRFQCKECGKTYKLLDLAKAHYKKNHFYIDFTDDCIKTLN